jgi:M6 family metalloprotease-like protein
MNTLKLRCRAAMEPGKMGYEARILMMVGLVLFRLCSTSYAGPAAPNLVTLSQPDGSRFSAIMRGDEFQNWIETLNSRHTVIYNHHKNQWEFAEKLPNGLLQPSGIRVMQGAKNAPSFLPTEVKPGRNDELEGHHLLHLQNVLQHRLNSAFSSAIDIQSPSASPEIFMPEAEDLSQASVVGPRYVLIVLVNFANRSLVSTAANWYSSIFSTTHGAKSVANFFAENSFGKMELSPIAHTQPGNPLGIITANIADSHPNSAGAFNYTVESTILNHALAQAASYVNFASYDVNGNGTLEQSELTIYFVYAGYEASGSGQRPSIWAHAWGGYNVLAGTKYVTSWAMNGELNNASVQHPMGVIAHELGHSLCGLPDLYDTSYTNAGVGNFSLMAGGSWGADTSEYLGTTPVALDAWSREYLGWTTPTTPSSNGPISLAGSLASAGNAIKLMNSSASSMEYWLVENRTATAGWDRGLRGLLASPTYAGGMLILHVDKNASINRYVAGSHQGVVVEQASTNPCNMLMTGCRGATNTLFSSGSNGNFGLYTTPNTNYYNNTVSNFSLANFSAAGSTMTAIFTSGETVAYIADGKPDILWRNPSTGQVCIWFMNGETLLNYAYTINADSAWIAAKVADFDGDGKPDILWRNTNTGQNCIWFMSGATLLRNASLPDAGVAWTIADVADFDGNGKPDILWRNLNTGQNCMWFMNGATLLRYANLPDAGVAWILAGVSDFDGDGKADILWRNSSTGQNCTWFMNGAVLLRHAYPPDAGLAWAIAGVADFNGDGKADILWRNSNTGQNCMWFMNGATLLRYANPPDAGVTWTIAGVADFDGDGKIDILWRNSSSGQNCIWFMNAATMLRYNFAPSAPSPWVIAGTIR